MAEKAIFEKLNNVNVNEKTEKKGKLTYLSWAYAWAEIKKLYPEANYKILRFGEEQLPYQKLDDMGYMVYTEVTIGDLTHAMWLPVMDYKNTAIKNPTATDINKTIMRCLTKNLAMHGLGLGIYSGEDLPEEETANQKQQKAERAAYIDDKERGWLMSEAQRLHDEKAQEALKSMLEAFNVSSTKSIKKDDLIKATKFIEMWQG